jgi:peptidoglycan hydrolase-like protein with peptidoglycan-binding domain
MKTRIITSLGCALLLSAVAAATPKKPVHKPAPAHASSRKAVQGTARHSTVARSQSARHTASSARGKHSARKSTASAAPGISSERATAIQAALIKNGYLTGTPSGNWDANTQAAMRKMQADNHWSTKNVPDARALNKLGLGAGTTPVESAASPEAAGKP